MGGEIEVGMGRDIEVWVSGEIEVGMGRDIEVRVSGEMELAPAVLAVLC
mgnify:CR=1 FL=1